MRVQVPTQRETSRPFFFRCDLSSSSGQSEARPQGSVGHHQSNAWVFCGRPKRWSSKSENPSPSKIEAKSALQDSKQQTTTKNKHPSGPPAFSRDPYILHLNMATCKWWFPFTLVWKNCHVSNGGNTESSFQGALFSLGPHGPSLSAFLSPPTKPDTSQPRFREAALRGSRQVPIRAEGDLRDSARAARGGRKNPGLGEVQARGIGVRVPEIYFLAGLSILVFFPPVCLFLGEYSCQEG